MTHPLANRYNAHGTAMEQTGGDNEAFVRSLFSSIAPRYDLLNSVMSLSRHRAWRRLAVRMAGVRPGDAALDVCCGTGDFAFALARAAGPEGRVVGVDFSEPMLDIARAKARRTGLERSEFVPGNALELPFDDGTFDCVTVGFGLRNVSDVSAAVAEMARVAKPGGRVVSLEIFGRKCGLMSLPWKLFARLIPKAAGALRTKRAAYEYLPWSVEEFISREDLAREFEDNGLADVRRRDLMLGTVCIHIGTRPIFLPANTAFSV